MQRSLEAGAETRCPVPAQSPYKECSWVIQMAYLRWVDSDGKELKFPLERNEVLIGRRTDSDIVLAYPFISRQHAKLIKSEAGYSILNLSEAHGTYVNRSRIERQQLQ